MIKAEQAIEQGDSEMDFLLVIDMQEDYVGENRNKRQFPYHDRELIANINELIDRYPASNVIYITNRFFFERKDTEKELVKGLQVVSGYVFEKTKKSCFSNERLLEFLREQNAERLELVGVDGNYCVAASACDGIKNGFDVHMVTDCIDVKNRRKYAHTRKMLEKNGVSFGPMV